MHSKHMQTARHRQDCVLSENNACTNETPHMNKSTVLWASRKHSKALIFSTAALQLRQLQERLC